MGEGGTEDEELDTVEQDEALLGRRLYACGGVYWVVVCMLREVSKSWSGWGKGYVQEA